MGANVVRQSTVSDVRQWSTLQLESALKRGDMLNAADIVKRTGLNGGDIFSLSVSDLEAKGITSFKDRVKLILFISTLQAGGGHGSRGESSTQDVTPQALPQQAPKAVIAAEDDSEFDVDKLVEAGKGQDVPAAGATKTDEQPVVTGEGEEEYYDDEGGDEDEIEYLVSHRMFGGEAQMQVHWANTEEDEDEWFPRVLLLEEHAQLVKDYEERNNVKW